MTDPVNIDEADQLLAAIRQWLAESPSEVVDDTADLLIDRPVVYGLPPELVPGLLLYAALGRLYAMGCFIDAARGGE